VIDRIAVLVELDVASQALTALVPRFVLSVDIATIELPLAQPLMAKTAVAPADISGVEWTPVLLGIVILTA
jgi:hypothetical protein